MPVEFIGIAHTADQSETITQVGPAVQPDYLYRLAVAHERSGFDRVLVAHSSSMPDGFIVADQILNATIRLGVLLAHRPGFIAPTVAARKFATIDAFHPGRIALHVITGGDDADQARDGDFTDKQTRYRRTDEFLDVVQREWSSAEPFDYDGEFYRVAGARSALRPGHLPVYFGGASADAVRVGGRHADVYAFWGEPLAGIRQRMAQVRASATAAGRSIDRFSVSLRPIAAATETAAWRRARQLLELTRERAAEFAGARDATQAEGSRRLLRYAAAAEVHDKRLWTPLSAATGAAGNSTALVGSYEQVAESLLDYVAVGATTLLIRGYDPLADAAAYASLIRLVHEQVGEDIDGYRARVAA
ncbi:MAG TPA: LLM class flavin-dependent oxidoreductase [Streptosporangiaceae bacterium]|jgi:alkanesulfonate monooxygenase|nr:LLM class flavin-dependent oxidoreductase [Streptosporangiaceae bacterium]